MNQVKKILIIEDEENIINVLSTILTSNSYKPLVAKSGEQGLLMVSSHLPDLVLLDLGLPGIDGIDVLKEIRKKSAIPVIIISARGKENEKVQALDLGADDYVTKPFGSSELMARVRTALRHVQKGGRGSQEDRPYSVGGLLIDTERRVVEVEGKAIRLTPIEFKLVALLASQPGKVMTYDYMMEQIWGPYLNEDNKILRVNMANIRRKIEQNPGEPKYFITEVGVGYRLVAEVEGAK